MADDVLTNIKAEASRIEEDALHSGKAHFEAASRWRHVHFWLGLPSAVASALAALSLLKANPPLTAALSVLAAVLTSLITFLKPDAKASGHAASGNRYLSIRSRARLFRTIDIPSAKELAPLSTAVKELAEQRDQLNETSEQIPRWAYKRAKKGIDAGEGTHAVDTKKKPTKSARPS
jgi:hypothetical protein